MNADFPVWMLVYFGFFGSTGAVLFTLVIWYWMKFHSSARGYMRSAAKWSVFGYAFLFIGAWFACGIGGPPGNMLSSDPVMQNLSSAIRAATLSMFFSVPGWACVLVGMRKMMRGTRSD